jgi:hypothetical protein
MVALLFLLFLPAHAYVYVGNPPLTVRIVRPEGDLASGSVWLLGIRVHKCGGGYDEYAADLLIDPTDGWSTQIAGGNLCSVSVRWFSDVLVLSETFEIRYEYPTTQVQLTGAAYDQSALSPFVVESGSFFGSPPQVQITIAD